LGKLHVGEAPQIHQEKRGIRVRGCLENRPQTHFAGGRLHTQGGKGVRRTYKLTGFNEVGSGKESERTPTRVHVGKRPPKRDGLSKGNKTMPRANPVKDTCAKGPAGAGLMWCRPEHRRFQENSMEGNTNIFKFRFGCQTRRRVRRCNIPGKGRCPEQVASG